MTGYEGLPPQDGHGEDTPTSRQEEITRLLAELVSHTGLDPEIAQAYAPEATGLYRYPGMEVMLADHLDESKWESVVEFQRIHIEAYEQHFADPEIQQAIQQMKRRLSADGQPATDERLLTLLVHNGPLGQYLSRTGADDALGLRRSPLIRAIIQADYLHYFTELPSADIPIPDEGALSDIRDYALLGTGWAPAFSFASDVAARLRELGVVDLSKDHLDARRASLSAVAQFEAAIMLLNQIAFLPLIRSSTGVRTADALARRYERALMTDDVPGKIALALRYGMPRVLAAMVSMTFDGAALVAADLGLRRAVMADSAVAVKCLMFGAVGLSAWLNFEHGVLLGYPVAVRVLFAAPSVLAGWLFELQLRHLHRERLHALRRTMEPLPQFGWIVWVFHPVDALRHLSQIAGSRLHSIPVTVINWTGAPASVHEVADIPVVRPVLLAAPVEPMGAVPHEEESCTRQRAGRSPVPDELYMGQLRVLVDENGGVVLSAREVARRLSIGQDRARRLVGMLDGEAEEEPPVHPIDPGELSEERLAHEVAATEAIAGTVPLDEPARSSG